MMIQEVIILESGFKSITVFGREFLYREEVLERKVINFLSKINFDGPNGCWIWTGSKTQQGYGRMYSTGSKAAHRIGWFMLRGPIAEDIHLHHQTEPPINCIGGICVNPDHLKPLDAATHARINPNNVAVINSLKTHCPLGHDLSGENLYIYPNGLKRRCVICHNAYMQRIREAERINKPNEVKTACKNGHPINEETSYMYAGMRMCRACHNDITKAISKKKYQEATHCSAGHPYDETTVITKNGRRRCLACHAAAQKKLRPDKKEGFCVNGHEMTPENTVTVFSRGRNWDLCVICRRKSGADSYARKKAKFANSSIDSATEQA